MLAKSNKGWTGDLTRTYTYKGWWQLRVEIDSLNLHLINCRFREDMTRIVIATSRPAGLNAAASAVRSIVRWAQLSAQYLADVALRQFIPELDVLRPLVGSEVVAAKGADVLFRKR